MTLIKDDTTKKYRYLVVRKIRTVHWNEKAAALTRSIEWVDWPSVCYDDVYNYLISMSSEYTHEMLKAYKDMDGYDFFMNGWINNIPVTLIDGSND